MRSGLVAILGWTNVGKSTLLNHLIGEKVAAVADVAQTTRHRILGVRNEPGRGQLVFVDTPGIHRPKHRMNRAMVQSSQDALREVDVALLVVDAAHGIGPGDAEVAVMLRRSDAVPLVAFNKIDDVPNKSRLLPMLHTAVEDWGMREAIPISARSGEGCDVLVDRLLEALPEAEPLYPEDYLTDQTERSLVAEFVREKLLHATREELPHSIATMVEHWEDDPEGVTRVVVSILVDRESQKGIVIGRGGAVLKDVGTSARAELEDLLGRRLHLELWVKVRRHWRDDEDILEKLGISG